MTEDSQEAHRRTEFTRAEVEKRPWMPAFIEALHAERGNVCAACRSTRTPRRTAYDARETVPAFAAAWDDATEDQTDYIEFNAVKLAADGWTEPIFHNGELVGEKRVYSAPLMLGLLKARRRAVYGEQKTDDSVTNSGIAAALAATVLAMRANDGITDPDAA